MAALSGACTGNGPADEETDATDDLIADWCATWEASGHDEMPLPVLPPVAYMACQNPETLLHDGPDGPVPSGLERCEDGRIHRVEVADCALPVGEVGTCPEPDSSGPDNPGCGDCSANGLYCNEYSGEGFLTCRCDEFAIDDAACPPGQVAFCDGTYSRCMDGSCGTDADCGAGAMCIAHPQEVASCARPEFSFRCEQPVDTCRFDEDCEICEEGSGQLGCVEGHCRVSPDGGQCGRPLRVDDHARVAPLTSRTDWADDIGQDPRSEAAGAGWTAIALLEHASVASFAKFTLELLALGAPADLVAEAQAAQADEIDHARVSFGLARRFGAGDVGPGPLDLTGLVIETDPERFVRALVLEGCVGETLSAAEVREGARRAADEGVRALLHRVADDESRHAALAWNTLAWLLGEDPTLVGAARSAFVEARGADEADAVEGLEAFGLLGGRARREVRAAAWAVVVEPAIGALLSVGGRIAATEGPCVAI